MRIIAGEFRGRRLVAPQGLATRPTTDRVREAWFSILGPLEGQAIDLYAGTGALGFEALSRGAQRVVFVESARPAQKAIQRNAQQLGVSSRVVVLGSRVETAASQILGRGPFDLVLTDPPWTDMERAQEALLRLLTKELLTARGRVMLGHPKKQPVKLSANSGLTPKMERSWGDSGATLFCRDSDVAEL